MIRERKLSRRRQDTKDKEEEESLTEARGRREHRERKKFNHRVLLTSGQLGVSCELPNLSLNIHSSSYFAKHEG